MKPSPSGSADAPWQSDLQQPAVNLTARLPVSMGEIRLRALRDDDLDAFLSYRSDAEVARYQGWWPMDEAKARAFLREQGANVNADSAGRWVQLAIADAATDVLLGDIGLWSSHDWTEAELGITVMPAVQGRGVGRSAVRVALTLLFADPRVARVHANADARNTPSRRMLVAAGFRQVGSSDVFVKEEACVEHQYVVERGWPVPTLEGDVP